MACNYLTEKGATVVRTGEAEICVGGKIHIPIFPVNQDFKQSPHASQYAWVCLFT